MQEVTGSSPVSPTTTLVHGGIQAMVHRLVGPATDDPHEGSVAISNQCLTIPPMTSRSEAMFDGLPT